MASSPSLIPPSLRHPDLSDQTGRFRSLEAPSDTSRARLREVVEHHASALADNQRAHRRFRQRFEQIRQAWSERPLAALVVEDFDATRRVLRRYLERLHFARIDEAVDVAGAKEHVQRERYDLLVVDVRLAHGDIGFDVVDLVRTESKRPLVPVLVISGNLDEDRGPHKLLGEELDRWSDRSGANDCLEKPFTFDEFAHRVRRMIGEARPRTALRGV